HVPLPQQDVLLAVQLHLGPVLGVEEHAVARLDGPYVRAHPDGGRPGEAPADGRGGRDHDAGGRAAFTLATLDADEHPVVQQPADAVAGVTVPAAEPRPPSPRSTRPRTRSCSRRMGRLASVADVALAGTAVTSGTVPCRVAGVPAESRLR